MDQIKKVFAWVVAPLAFLAGFIYYLLMKNEKLSSKVALLQTDNRLQKTKDKVEEDDKNVKDAINEFESIAGDYERRTGGRMYPHNPSSPESDRGPKAGDPGSKDRA